jgi:butyrate kinase
MCIAQGRVVDVTRALEEAGALGEEASGEIVIREAPKAYTYS